MKAKYKKQSHELTRVCSENEQLKAELAAVKMKSRALRDRFVMDIGVVLRESKRIYEQQSEKAELEKQLEKTKLIAIELSDRIRELEGTIFEQQEQIQSLSGLPSVHVTASKMKFLELDDNKLLQVFAFLDTMDVIATAQTCKSLYTRVSVLFGIESGVAQEQMEGAPAVSTIALGESVSEKVASDEVRGGVTVSALPDKMKQQLDELSKKLNGKLRHTLLYYRTCIYR